MHWYVRRKGEKRKRNEILLLNEKAYESLGLSFLGYEGFAPVDHRYCMPQSVIDKLELPEQPLLQLD